MNFISILGFSCTHYLGFQIFILGSQESEKPKIKKSISHFSFFFLLCLLPFSLIDNFPS